MSNGGGVDDGCGDGDKTGITGFKKKRGGSLRGVEMEEDTMEKLVDEYLLPGMRILFLTHLKKLNREGKSTRQTMNSIERLGNKIRKLTEER